MNSSRPSQLTKWFFTWNNYPIDFKKILENKFQINAKKYAFQPELSESGTKHIQGVVFLKKKMRWSQFGLPKDIHWEPVKGSDQQAIAYVLKQETRDGQPTWFNVIPPQNIEILHFNQMFQWQKEVILIINQKPNDRIIFWYYEEEGRSGKSALVKFLCFKYKAITLTGRGIDMKNAIVKYKQAHGNYPQIVLFDIPRSAEDFINYPGLEEVKNGCFLSTKYECEMVIMNSPHILCFANFEPDYGALSMDRWDIRQINMDPKEKQQIIQKADGHLFIQKQKTNTEQITLCDLQQKTNTDTQPKSIVIQ